MNECKKTEILYLSANPGDGKQLSGFEELGLNYEAAVINARLRRARCGNQLNMDAFYHVHFGEIREYLEKYQPEVLHLACPFEKDKLIFAGDGISGEFPYATIPEAVDPSALVELLKTCAGSVKLLVLRVFGSKPLADRIYQDTEIKAVLHLGTKHDTEATHEFLGAVYQLLANGINLRRSFNLARKTSGVHNCELHSSVEDGLLTLVERPAEDRCFSLLLASTPVGDRKLPYLPEELDYITRRISGGECPALYPSSASEVLMAITYYQPRVLLFSVHGAMDYISFYDEKQGRTKLDKDWLVDVFGEFRDRIECVFMGSCENMALSCAVSRHIPYVIGTKTEVTDRMASLVSRYFFVNLLEHAENLEYAENSEYAENPEYAENLDYAKAFYLAKNAAMTTPGLSIADLRSLKDFSLFSRSDYQNPAKRKAQKKELTEISQDKLLHKYKKYKNDRYLVQFKKYFTDWIEQIHNDKMYELVASFARNMTYISSTDVSGFLMSEHENLACRIEPKRTVYVTYSGEPEHHAEEYATLYRILNGIEPNRFYQEPDHIGSRIGEIFDLVLIADFVSSADNFQRYVEKNREYLLKKRITLLTICGMKHTLEEIIAYANKEKLDLRIVCLRKLPRAFDLYPKYDRQIRNFEKYCMKQLGMEYAQIHGKNQAQALCILHDRIPEETLGIFTWSKEEFSPLFVRSDTKEM